MLRALTASQPLKAAAARQARVFSTSFTAMVSTCLYALLFSPLLYTFDSSCILNGTCPCSKNSVLNATLLAISKSLLIVTGVLRLSGKVTYNVLHEIRHLISHMEIALFRTLTLVDLVNACLNP